MDFINIFITIITHLIIGLSISILYYHIFKKHFLGNFFGAFITGTIGSYFGGLLYFYLKDIIAHILNLIPSVNLLAAVVGAVVLINILNKITENAAEDEE